MLVTRVGHSPVIAGQAKVVRQGHSQDKKSVHRSEFGSVGSMAGHRHGQDRAADRHSYNIVRHGGKAAG